MFSFYRTPVTMGGISCNPSHKINRRIFYPIVIHSRVAVMTSLSKGDARKLTSILLSSQLKNTVIQSIPYNSYI